MTQYTERQKGIIEAADMVDAWVNFLDAKCFETTDEILIGQYRACEKVLNVLSERLRAKVENG